MARARGSDLAKSLPMMGTRPRRRSGASGASVGAPAHTVADDRTRMRPLSIDVKVMTLGASSGPRIVRAGGSALSATVADRDGEA